MAVGSPIGETRGRGVGKRRRGREMALQMLYQSDMGGATLPQVLLHFNPVDYLEAYREEGEGDALTREQYEQIKEALEYARRLVEGTLEHREELDGLIREQAENWRLERMSAVDRNVLRLAAFELLYEPDVPKLVVLDEAIELAKRYGSEQSGRFVNGLLDGLLKTRRFPGNLS
jgi:transcription antitermination protein NusB